jgi:hypothetical protein
VPEWSCPARARVIGFLLRKQPSRNRAHASGGCATSAFSGPLDPDGVRHATRQGGVSLSFALVITLEMVPERPPPRSDAHARICPSPAGSRIYPLAAQEVRNYPRLGSDGPMSAPADHRPVLASALRLRKQRETTLGRDREPQAGGAVVLAPIPNAAVADGII